LPCAAIPDDNRPAAIFALRDGAFKVAIVERVVLDMDSQPLFGRNKARTTGDCPACKHPIDLQPQIIVQPPGCMFLNDETVAGSACLGAAVGLCCLPEIPLLPVGFERHG